ncbi:MAG: hypothetical protein H7X89_00610 [Rhizobiales bacterium]|nr:hypothetical protein [Hyphomicrobiales bacterium]
MKYAVPALIVIVGTLAPTAARAESWAVYQDGLHECRLEYASDVFTQDSLDEEKFQRFSGPNKQTYFRVKGLPNQEKWSPAQIRAEYIKSRGAADVVYERTKRDFLVLSGFRGDNIFYTKVALSSDNEIICVLDISYPRKAKRAFDAVVTRMSRSFAAER